MPAPPEYVARRNDNAFDANALAVGRKRYFLLITCEDFGIDVLHNEFKTPDEAFHAGPIIVAVRYFLSF